MVDKEKSGGEEEYRFSELETSDIYGNPQSDADADNRFQQMRKIIFVLGVLALLFGVYKLWGVFHSKPKAAPANVLPAVSKAPEKTPVDQSIASLEQRSAHTQTEINKVATDVSELKSAIGNLQQGISELNSSLQGLSNQLQQQISLMQTQQQLLIALQPKPKPKPKKMVKKGPIREYYVEAAIPGRAWLRDSNGNPLTVSVGDRVTGYDGVVTGVDPHTGQVIMSSGKIITYRPDDR